MSIKHTIINSSQPLFAFVRKSIPEVVVHGIVHIKRQGQEPTGHNLMTQVVGRSLLKPWQFLASHVSGRERFWSMGLASHSSQSIHVENLELLAKAASSGESELFCPRSFPMDSLLAAKMQLSGERPSRMQHPCSGKHLVMLASCHTHGYDPDSYFDVDHPIQKKLQAKVGQLLDEKPTWVLDSCGLPTLSATVRSHMHMWEKMALNEDADYVAMKDLWLQNPVLVGGHERLDTALMEIGNGNLIVKEGADGLLMIQSLAYSDIPAVSVLIKLASGYSSANLAIALWSVVSREKGLPPVFDDIAEFLKSKLEKWVPGDQSLVLAPFN